MSMQEDNANTPNGVSNQGEMRVESVSDKEMQILTHMKDKQVKVNFADFHANKDRDRDGNESSASSSDTDASVGSTASGVEPVEIDTSNTIDMQALLQQGMSVEIKAETQDTKMKKSDRENEQRQ